MARLSLSSLRGRLLLLVLLAILPILGLILYAALEQERLAAFQAHTHALRLARLAVAGHERVLRRVRQHLSALARTPDVRTGTVACETTLIAEVLKYAPQYVTLASASPEGSVVCCTHPLSDPVNLAGQTFFDRAFTARAFTVGTTPLPSLTQKPALPLAYPVTDDAGTVQRVLVALLDLEWLYQAMVTAQLPDGSLLALRDPAGATLVRYPGPGQNGEQSMPDFPLTPAQLISQGEGTAEVVGSDTVHYLYAFLPLREESTLIGYVIVGLPATIMSIDTSYLLVRHLAWLGLVIGLAATVIWLGTGWITRRMAHPVLDTTQRLLEGDLSARTEPLDQQGILGELAYAVDAIGESLERRDAECDRLQYEWQQNRAELAERKNRYEVELAERKNRYEMAIQATGQVLYDWNAKTNEVTWGGMLEQTLGYAPQEVSSQVAWWTGLIHPEDRPGFQEAFDRALATQTSSRLEYRVRKKDGTYITVEDTWYVVFDEASTVARLVGFVSDITARRRAEEEVQRLNAELEQHVIERTAQLETANKELEAFSYSVSHDLRAPLRAMDGFSRILLEDYAPQLTSDAARYLQMVRESAQRMGSLIDDLLTFSRLGRQPLTKQPVAPADLVRQTLTELRVEQENRRVEINLGELPLCQADPALLKQVFVNLLTNALKFTRRRELACIEIGCQQLNGDQIYFVKDNGVGFDMQYVHKLFGVFQRLHRIEDYEGTGVGLAIVQRILHRHGGRVWAEAAIDEGATFYFTVGEQQEQEA